MYLKNLTGSICLLVLGFASGYAANVDTLEAVSNPNTSTTIPAGKTSTHNTALITTETTAKTDLCQIHAKEEDLINSSDQLDALYCLWRDNTLNNLNQISKKIQKIADQSNDQRARRLAQLILEHQANISTADTINPHKIETAQTQPEDIAQNSDIPNIIALPLSGTLEETYQLIDKLQTSGDDSAIESLRVLMGDAQEAIRTAAADGLLQLLDNNRGNHELISSALNDSAPFLNDQQAAHFSNIISGQKDREL